MQMKSAAQYQEHDPVVIELTDEQKQIIAAVIQKSGHQVGLKLHVEVIDGRISPAFISTCMA